MYMQITQNRRRQYIISGLLVVFLGLASFAILPQLSSFQGSLSTLRAAQPGLVVLAAISSLLASVVSGFLFLKLAFKPLRFSSTLLVQLSGLFINRVLPAGIGGIGLNVWYLRRQGHTTAQAGIVVTLNNTLGFVGHNILMVLFFIFAAGDAARALSGRSGGPLLLIAVPLFMIITGATILYFFRRRFGRFGRQVARELLRLKRRYNDKPRAVAGVIGLSMALTMCSVISFWLSSQAVGATISLPVAFFVYSFAVLLGTATPTPGGLGGFEAALFAGLVAQSVPAPTALAAALLYRLVSYWLGLIVGAGSSLMLKRQSVA